MKSINGIMNFIISIKTQIFINLYIIYNLMGEKASLKRELGLLEVTLSGVGIILGAGIYALLGRASGLAGTSFWKKAGFYCGLADNLKRSDRGFNCGSRIRRLFQSIIQYAYNYLGVCPDNCSFFSTFLGNKRIGTVRNYLYTY